jgi:diguanylate cyclase (GGDEF)-like protein/putative nucleotidyltransferase with HDIG domain
MVTPFSASLNLFRTEWTVFVLMLPQPLAAFSMFIVLYEEDKRALERHMLELAGLNLITSSAQQAATVQDMLGRTLERLQAALRVPSSVIGLRLDDAAPLTCIHRGQDGFLRQLDRAGLLQYLQRTVARLGDLLALPDLNSSVAHAPFAREEEFRQVAHLAQAGGVRLLLGVSLRVKAGSRGVLLLASPQARRFTPAELRLLLGLGGQIGMAVDNYRLLQQTSRRSEELRLLNEVGRALSSVRSVEELLESVQAEMRRVLNVSNFFIAFYDPAKKEISFELEVKEGSFLPKRRRPTRNGLTEHILAQKGPLLIGEDFEQKVAELGIEPGRIAQSFCGVPILLHGEAMGVIAIVSYTGKNAFDREHLEVLATLAAQTAVAIENARLFAAEQKRGRQLTLLNNVARQAISTLNPEEMLSAITREIRSGLAYDYVGVGVLDYNNREVAIPSEARPGARGVNRRYQLGEGSVGQVAMSGDCRQFAELTAGLPASVQPVLSGARSLVTLPVTYADQLLGVLEVESRQPNAFHDEDVLLLRTLADQVGSALHNAFVFQRAQEQAITDGLTGVKTHRFFMEGLNAEWRRAARVGRDFSLLLMDLDKFKFVNDYFGHLEGDTILQRVGRILEQNVRRSDLVARYGGDEFVVLMPETNVQQAYLLGDKLRQWLATDPMLREKRITASVGIATYPQHAAAPEELIQIADASMYLAKHQGGNTIVSADHYKRSEQKQWQRHVLEAYLGVTIKRLFATGPEAFEQVYRRLEQVVDSLGTRGEGQVVPPPVLDTVTSLAFALDAKNHYTQGHSQNVARYCLQVARHLDLSDEEMENLRLAAVLHDIGKLGVPERLLVKPGPLDPEEYETMKQHSTLGAKLLEPLHTVDGVQRIIRHHHERWDGSGYPDCLKGEEIPLASRLIAIVDAYDTMITERTYKPSRSREEAFEELRRWAGRQFDPQLVEVFLETVVGEVEPAGERPPVARA